MIPPVVIKFQAGGIADVHRAFQSIQRDVGRIAAAEARTAQQGARARVSATEKAEQARERAMARLRKEADRMMREDNRAFEKAEKEKTRVAEREADKQLAIAKRLADQEGRAHEKAARAANQARQRFARAIGGAAAQGLANGVRGVTGAAMSLAGTALSLGGGFSITDSMQRSLRATGLAADIAQSGFQPQGSKEVNRTKRSTGEILNVARGASTRFGIDQEESLQGLQNFVAVSGDLDQGLKLLPQLAELSRATGSSLADVAEAAGNVSMNLGEIDKDGTKTMAVMRGIAAQGKMGAVEMRDLATQMSKLTASAGQFSGDEVQNMLLMGALAQEARGAGGAASPAMAATAVTGFVNTLKTPARISAFKEAGVDLRDKKTGMLRDPREIIVQSLHQTKGDSEKMKKLFANIMGERAVQGFTTTYLKAGGGAKGEEAVRKRFGELMTNMSPQEVAKAASERMQEQDAKIAQTMAEFDRLVAEELVPEVTKMMPMIKETMPQFIALLKEAIPPFRDLIKSVADFTSSNRETLDFLAQHPIGTMITAAIAADLGKAMIGEAVKATLLRLLAGGGAGNAAGGVLTNVAGPATSGASTFGGILTGVAATGYMGYEWSKAAFGWEGKSSGQQRAAELTAGVKAGTITPEQAQQEMIKARGTLREQSERGRSDVALAPFSSESQERMQKAFAARELLDSEELKKAIRDALVSGAKEAGPQIASSISNPNNPSRNVNQGAPARGGAQ